MLLPRQLSSLYHTTHYLVLIYYFCIAYPLVLRPNAKANKQAHLFDEGIFLHFGMEVDVFVGLGVVFLYDVLCNVRTFDEGMHRFLVDAKILSLILTFLAGDHYFLFGLVALYWSMAVLLVPPQYEGPSRVVLLTNRTFHANIIEQSDQEKPYLVMFSSKWDSQCHFFFPEFCELSLSYPQYTFGSLDIANCSDLAKTFMIEDENGEPQQLPALIMFHKGQEVRRIPEIDSIGKAIKCSVRKDIVVHHFQLDQDPLNVEYLKISKGKTD